MQGRTVGSPRTIAGKQGHFGSGRADVIAAQPMLGRAHGSRPALFRSLLTVSMIAGGLSAALIGSGVDLAKVGLSPAVSVAEAATEIPMPRPRIHTVALSTPLEQTPLRAAASFAPVHDLDTELGSNTVDRVSYDLLLSESAVGDPNDILEFGPMKIRRHLVQTIVRAAQAVQSVQRVRLVETIR